MRLIQDDIFFVWPTRIKLSKVIKTCPIVLGKESSRMQSYQKKRFLKMHTFEGFNEKEWQKKYNCYNDSSTVIDYWFN